MLINGESGTGKELLARAIHREPAKQQAVRRDQLQRDGRESARVGTVRPRERRVHGATRSHKGLFQAAEGGTLLLDEIGDMPMRLQVKLLRVLQENQVRPVGSTDALQVDVRVISATHRDLQEMMREGKFREDLFYRLNVVNINLPTLDERREDIPSPGVTLPAGDRARSRSGAQSVCARGGRAPGTAEWPGNVRQLYNVVRQNVALSRSPVISGELVAVVTR